MKVEEENLQLKAENNCLREQLRNFVHEAAARRDQAAASARRARVSTPDNEEQDNSKRRRLSAPECDSEGPSFQVRIQSDKSDSSTHTDSQQTGQQEAPQ